MAGLELRGVTVEYENFRLSDISFSCKPGDVVALVGKNGAGKTTTINSILRLVKKSSGKVFYNGEEICEDNIHQLKQVVGYLVGSKDFYPNIQVKKILRFLSGVYRKWNHELMAQYCNVFQIDLNKKISALSTGTKTKLGLAIALSHSAELLLLDEPTTGLDPIVREDVLAILSTFARENHLAVFFSSHITQDIEKIASHIIFLVDGHIMLNIEKNQMYNDFMKIKKDASFDYKEDILRLGVILHNQYVIIKRSDLPEGVVLKPGDTVDLLVEDVLIYLNGGIV